MKDNRDINEAIFGGILVFSVVFFSMKDLFSQENRVNFIVLIFVYLFASLCRIFGIILGSDRINAWSIHYCRLVLIPITVWTTMTIILTEIGSYGVLNPFISSYFFFFTEVIILSNNYGIKLKFQSPLKLEKEKKN